jgi:hypothetical protein
VFLMISGSAHSQVIYSNDFQGAVGTEWSNSTTDITPVGARRFLGQFASQTVSLSLGTGSPILPGGLPAHSDLTVSFDLFVIRSWDGNSTDTEGPDIWSLSVLGGSTVINTTFNGGAAFHAPFGQAFPGTYPGSMFPPRTGAAENDTLGYIFVGPDHNGPMDSVYHMSLTIPHSSNGITLNFAASLLTVGGPSPLANESWGLDNVIVTASQVPEPASLTLLGTSLIGLAAQRIKRRQRFSRRSESD